jgi:hypothetical protein
MNDRFAARPIRRPTKSRSVQPTESPLNRMIHFPTDHFTSKPWDSPLWLIAVKPKCVENIDQEERVRMRKRLDAHSSNSLVFRLKKKLFDPSGLHRRRSAGLGATVHLSIILYDNKQ